MVEAVWELLDACVAGPRLDSSPEGSARRKRAAQNFSDWRPVNRWYGNSSLRLSVLGIRDQLHFPLQARRPEVHRLAPRQPLAQRPFLNCGASNLIA